MIDSHGHPIADAGGRLELSAINVELATDESSREHRRQSSPSRLSHELLAVRLAEHLGCAVADVPDARGEASRDWPAYVRGLFQAAGIRGMVLDPGWNLEAPTSAASAFQDMIGCPVRPILRLEPLIDRLIAEGAGAGEILTATEQAMREAPAHGYYGFKTIIAYRTGLAVDPGAGLAQAERSLEESPDLPVRRRGKALRDLLLRRALGWAAEMQLPFQIHTGFGDSEIRLAEANPVLLEELLRTSEGAAATILLIHGSYPWHEELAYLTLAKPNVYAELSMFNLYAVATVADRMERVLELAPTAKVLCGTDGHGHPETFWFGALLIQEAWSRVRDRWAQQGARASWLDQVGSSIMEANTSRLYRF
ncbi:MAG: amidohydrolase family protein [Candidatus Dormibacteria bacterium]